MNPLTNMKNVKKLGEQELQRHSKSSWHDQYRDSAWVFVGGLPYDLTEGDLIAVFSQYGEIVNINLIRDKDTGKSKGFCFVCYEDQRSTDLAVDNFNGIKLLGRIIRVDHVSNYKVPKDGKKTDEVTKQLYKEGCAPQLQPPAPPPNSMKQFQLKPQDLRETLSDQVSSDIKLPMRLPIYIVKDEAGSTIAPSETVDEESTVVVKEKKHKKHKKKSRKKKKYDSSNSSSEESDCKHTHKKEKKKRTYEEGNKHEKYSKN